jgi:ComF family protein
VDVLATACRWLLDAVAPRRCAGCDAVSAEPLCTPCAGLLDALPIPSPRQMQHGTALAGFEFTDLVRTVLHRGKYGGDRAALGALGTLTAGRLDRAPSFPDAVVAVPLGPRRRHHRGYNQSDVVAESLANAWRVPVLPGLRRTRDTAPQTALDEALRQSNVAGAFTWDGIPLASAAVWLIDDVLTTGATVESAATVLARAGASRIDVVVIAVVP